MDIDILQRMDAEQIFSLTNNTKVHEVIGKLKFLAKIKLGEKINVKDLFVRDNDSITQRFLRTVRNWTTYFSASDTVESKEATLAFIQDTVNTALTLIAVYQSESDKYKKNLAELITKNLEESKNGIRNLISTYQNDRRFISEAEAVIQTLEVRIVSMKIKGLTDSSFMPNIDLIDNSK